MKYEHFVSIETPAVALHLLFDRIGKAAASKRLEAVYQLCNQAGINYSLIVVFLLKALNASTPDLALKYLGEALAKGKTEGFIRIFVDFGSVLAPLLKQAITQGIEPEYATKLLTIIEIEEQQRKTRRKVVMAFDVLSEREVEVLRLLAAGLSNQEIAGKLVISLNTTKTHIRHIFDKLEAKGRMSAIARAKELKIL
jgi:LuxR family maltose regulon positive regulatory protein